MLESLSRRSTKENRPIGQHYMKYYSHTEQIANASISSIRILEVRDLRSQIAGCPALNKKKLSRPSFICETEVSNNTLAVAILPEHDVLRLEVSMHVPLLVNGFHSLQNTQHYLPNLLCSHSVGPVNSIKELTS